MKARLTPPPLPATEEWSLPSPQARKVEIRWRRNPRARRITLRIDTRTGGVIVTLPPRANRTAGLNLLHQHTDWIADRLSALPSATILAADSSVAVNGVAHPIRHKPQGRGGAWIENGEIHVAGDLAFLPRRVTDLLRREASRLLPAQAMAKAAQAGLKPRRIVCKDTRSRWGSCSADGVVMLCWRLIMAPPYVQDYVVAHEIAHLRHMDHSARFWAAVRELTPYRDAATQWLKHEGASLLRVS